MTGRYIHLNLKRSDVSFDRKKRQMKYTAPPNRGGRVAFAPQIRTKFSDIATEQNTKNAALGLVPHLLLKIPLADGVQPDAMMRILEDAGLTTVGLEGREAIIAFKAESELSAFNNALDIYRRGPIQKPDGSTPKSTKWDILEYINIEQIRSYDRSDRIDGSILQLFGQNFELLDDETEIILDLELWNHGDTLANKRAFEEIKNVVDASAPRTRILDRFVGESSVLLRIRIAKPVLMKVAEMSVVAEIAFPPKPTFHASEVFAADITTFPPPPAPAADGPRVCIIDSGVNANHQLLKNHVAHTEAFLTDTSTTTDVNGHGTSVAGVAIFGDVRECIQNKTFLSPIVAYSARVLNDKNEFDNDRLIATQIRTAVEFFRKAPYNCRIFNLSLGTLAPSPALVNSRQTVWAETLDEIGRELEVLLVVSAGNTSVETNNSADADGLRTQYPSHFLHSDFGLCDPATSATAIVVGAIAQHDVAASRTGTTQDDLIPAIARKDEPSPFSKRGPGIAKAIKPDFVDYGGNLVFAGTQELRRISKDPGTSVVSFSWKDSLFNHSVGTSLAAPLVARKAALLEHKLKEDFQTQPHPNLLRAIMACAATTPIACQSLLESPTRVIPQTGYGQVDLDFCLGSENENVMLVYQGEIELDKFSIFEIPVPSELQKVPGDKEFRVSMAFDPPVRRRRADYLGVEMQFELLRSVTAEEIVEAYKKIGADDESPTLKSSAKLSLDPKQNAVFNRRKSTLQRGTFVAKRLSAAQGETYFLVVRSHRKWAPETISSQKFALAVSIKASHPELYNLVRQRVQPRVRVRRG